MKVFLKIGAYSVPSYGLMITLGVIVANLIALLLLRKKKLDLNDFILTQAYCYLGAFVGAKGLYLLVSATEIDFSKLTDFRTIFEWLKGGFVFYGGLIGGLLLALLAGKFHHFRSTTYIREFIFLIPMIHAFGRVGCFLAGCCYGIPYEGPFAVVFPENSFAPPGINLFPVQLAEAIGLLIISALLLYLQLRRGFSHTVEFYLISYAMLRFLLEYVRYDAARGFFLFLSTSQWISIFMILVAIGMLFMKQKKKRLPV